MNVPRFPEFKKIEIYDRDLFQEILWNYQPETSELTFTNLFMWRKRYRFRYSLFDQWLLLIAEADGHLYAFQPVGPPGRARVMIQVFEWLRTHRISYVPEICRVDRRSIDELGGIKDLSIEPLRNHFDYVYLSKDLVELAGRQYHPKRNHLNRFLNAFTFRYEPLTSSNIRHCIEFSSSWCRAFHCNDDLSLCAEWVAIHEALHHFEQLRLHGGVLWVGRRVEAFTFGELLNNTTAVIHIEKANPEINGIYAAINQMFCEHQFSGTLFVNREQDLGDQGLRKSKESYHPVRLVEKFRVSLTQM
jgi:hypothetical protein